MSELSTGRVGELITALFLEKLGVKTNICNFEAFDLMASYESKIYRIQVKARTKPDTSRSTHYMWCTSKGGRKYPLGTADCDIVALVAIPQNNIYFLPVLQTMNVTKRIKVSAFDNPDLAENTWKQATYLTKPHSSSFKTA